MPSLIQNKKRNKLSLNCEINPIFCKDSILLFYQLFFNQSIHPSSFIIKSSILNKTLNLNKKNYKNYNESQIKKA